MEHRLAKIEDELDQIYLLLDDMRKRLGHPCQIDHCRGTTRLQEPFCAPHMALVPMSIGEELMRVQADRQAHPEDNDLRGRHMRILSSARAVVRNAE